MKVIFPWIVFVWIYFFFSKGLWATPALLLNFGIVLKRHCATAAMRRITSSPHRCNTSWQHSLRNRPTKAGSLVPLCCCLPKFALTSSTALNLQFRLSVTAKRNTLKIPLGSDIRQPLTRKLETLINTIQICWPFCIPRSQQVFPLWLSISGEHEQKLSVG